MNQDDRTIQKAYFWLDECRYNRMRWMRIWRPDLIKFKEGPPKPPARATLARREMLQEQGYGPEAYDLWEQREKEAREALEALAREHPLWEHFQRISKMGPYLCGAFVAAGGDIEVASNPSKFLKGMGLDVLPNGHAPRNQRGKEKRNEERPIPALGFVTEVGEQIRGQILRGAGKGYQMYLTEKAFYQVKHPEWAKIIVHKASLRAVQKLLYSTLWKCWREGRGLDAPAPYLFAVQGQEGPHRLRYISEFYDKEPVEKGTDSK